MSHPGVGPVTALATDVFLGDPTRLADGKAVVSYAGMIPSDLGDTALTACLEGAKLPPLEAGADNT